MLRPPLLVLALLFYGCEEPEPNRRITVDPGTDEAKAEPQVKFVGNLPEDGDTSASLSIAVEAGNEATASYQWAWASGEGNCNGLSQYTDVADFDTKIEISDLGDDGSKIVCVKGKRADGTAQNTPLAHSWTKGDASEEEQNQQTEVEENLQVTATASIAPEKVLGKGAIVDLTEMSFTVERANDNSIADKYRYAFDAEPGDDESAFIDKCRAKAYPTEHELSEKIELNSQQIGADGKKLLCVQGIKDNSSSLYVFWWEKTSKPTATLIFGSAEAMEQTFRLHVVGKKEYPFLVFGGGEATKYKYVLFEGDKYQSCADVDWDSAAVKEGELTIDLDKSPMYERASTFELKNISAGLDKNYKTLCLIGLNDTDAQATANRYTWSFRHRRRDLASYPSTGAFAPFSSGDKGGYFCHIQNLDDEDVNYSVVLDEKSDGYDGFFAIKIANRADINKSSGWQQVEQEEGETTIQGSLAAGETRYVRMKLHHNYKTDFDKDEYHVKLLLKVDGRDDVPINLRLYVPQIEVKSNNTVITSKTHAVTLADSSGRRHQKIRIKNVGHAKSILAWEAFAKTFKHNWFYYIFRDSHNTRVYRRDDQGNYTKAFAKLLRLRKDEEVIIQVGMSCRGNTSMSQNNCDKSLWPQQANQSVTMRIVSNGKSPSASKEEYPHVSGGTKVEEEFERENEATKTNEYRIKWRTDLYHDITYTGATQ